MIIRDVLNYLLVLILILSPIRLFSQEEPSELELKQVLIFSRHHVRAPLLTNGSILEQSSSKEWPKWDVKGGGLTVRGGILEVYMGNYTRKWLENKGLLEIDSCPKSNQFYAYANSLQRTVATAQFFIAGAFPMCNIPVEHKLSLGNMDPVFHPAIHNERKESHITMEKEMTMAAEKVNLSETYKILEKIVGYRNSPNCLKNNDCSLSDKGNKNKFLIEKGEEPRMTGPLRIANSIIDAFSMQYYEGLPDDKVAWGSISTDELRKELAEVVNTYEDILFTTNDIAKDLAEPLIGYIDKNFNDDKISDKNPVVTLLIGHDSNIATLLSALEFDDYDLPDQYESTPIGGQLVFQRWYDHEEDISLFKVEYVYQTIDQIRKTKPLTLETPPRRVFLHLKGLTEKKEGFYIWDDFKKRLREVGSEE